jgi:hypothetical protein
VLNRAICYIEVTKANRRLKMKNPSIEKEVKMSIRDSKIWEYLGEHLLRSPEYLEKQFKIKMGFCSKLPKKKVVK